LEWLGRKSGLVRGKPRLIEKSGRGQPHSKTWRTFG
jgi:hypothetical protein